MPWKDRTVMDERIRFVARLLEGESMALLCREFDISRKTCRFRRSTQHLLGVYSREFGIPAFFLGVDSGAARLGRDTLASG